MSTGSRLLLVLVAASGVGSIASAAEVFWDYGAQLGGWSQVANWSNDQRPTEFDDVTIDWASVPVPPGGWASDKGPANTDYQISLNNNQQVRSLTISGTMPLNLWGNGPFSSNTQTRSLSIQAGIRVAADSGPVTISGATTMSYRNALLQFDGSQAIVNASANPLTFGYTARLDGTIAGATTPQTLTFSADGSGEIDVYGVIRNSSASAGVIVAIDSSGSGSVRFSGANTYTGGTTLRRGVLELGDNAALPSSGSVRFEGGTLAYGSGVTADVSARFSNAAGQEYRIDTAGANVAFASALTSSGGSLTKLGPGRLLLAGANTYGGGTVVAGGELVFGGSSLPAAGSVRIESGGALVASGPFVSPAAWVTSGRIDPASTGAVLLTADSSEGWNTAGYAGLSLGAASEATYSGPITPGGSAYRLGGGTGRLVVSSQLSGSRGLVVSGDGEVVLTGANTFTGPTTLAAGGLTLGSPGAVGSVSAIEFLGGTLRYSSANATDYSGRFATTAGQFFRIDTAGRDVTFAGPLTSVGGRLEKSGAGTLALAAAGTWGDTVVSGGGLALTGAGGLGQGSLLLDGGDVDLGGKSIAVPGGLTVAQGTLANGTVTTGSGIEVGTGTVTAGLSGASALRKTGSGTATLSGVNTYSGGTVVENGVLALANASALPSGGADVSLAGGGLLVGGPYASVSSWLASGRLVASSSGALVMTQASASLDAASGINLTAYPGVALGASGTVTYAGTIVPGTVPGATAPAWGFGGGGGVLQLQAPLAAGFGAGVNVGPDIAVVFAAANGYEGPVTITSGTLRIGSGGVLAGGASLVTVTQGGALEFDRPGAVSVPQPLSLSGGTLRVLRGDVVVTGTMLQLEGDRAERLYNPATPIPVSTTFDVAAGATLDISTEGGVSSLPVFVGAGIELTGAGEGVIGRAISGGQARDATLYKNGPGRWTLSNPANNWTSGGTIIQQGTLRLGASEVLPQGVGYGLVTVESAGILDLNGFTESVNGIVGSGTIDNTSSNPATLRVTGGSNQVTTFAGTIRDSGGPLSLFKSGSGSLTLSGSNGYSGSTSLTEGTLLVESAAALPGYALPGQVMVSGGLLTLRLGEAAWSASELTAFDAAATFSSGTLGLNVPGGGTFTYGGSLGSTQPFKDVTKLGSGLLVLEGRSDYVGTTRVANGTLLAAVPDALAGYGRLLGVQVSNGGTVAVRAGGSGGWTQPDIEVLLSNALFNSGSRVGIDVGAGTSFEFAGDLGAGGALKGFTKSGGGVLILSGFNAYQGGTTVAEGTLLVNGDNSGVTATTIVAAGATLGGLGTLGGSATIQSGATLSPGSSAGTLVINGNLTFAAGGNYNWEVADATGTAGVITGWDLVNVGGVLTINATTASPFDINLWSLAGSASGPAANFDSTQDYSWKIVSTTGGINGFAADKFRINVSATNGTDGFANPIGFGTFSVAQSGNDLNLVFTAGTGPVDIVINVPTGQTQTQGQAGYPALSGATPVLKTGAGTLVLDAANTLSATLAVNAGTAVAANTQALGTATLDVAAGATLAISPVVGAANAVQVADLGTIAGRIDVGTGRFALPASAESPGAELRGLLIAGRSGGTWDGAAGIMSSNAPSSGGGSGFAVGYRVLGDNSATVAWASLGDADLDGAVTTADVNAILTSGLLNTGIPGAVWQQGDFDYDGLVTTADINALLTTGRLNSGSYLPVLPVGAMGGPSVVGVPEPATLPTALVALGILVLSTRSLRSTRHGERRP